MATITVGIHGPLIIITGPGCTTITTEVMCIVRVIDPTGPDLRDHLNRQIGPCRAPPTQLPGRARGWPVYLLAPESASMPAYMTISNCSAAPHLSAIRPSSIAMYRSLRLSAGRPAHRGLASNWIPPPSAGNDAREDS